MKKILIPIVAVLAIVGFLFQQGYGKESETLDNHSIDNALQRTNAGSISPDKTVYPVPWEDRPPLKQFKDGVDPHKIQCRNDLHVLTKRPNGKMACVYPLTAEKLGWKIISADSTLTPSIFEVPKGDRVFDVEYHIKGGMVKDMVFSNNTNSLLVTIDSTDKGSLILSIPRNLLDAKFDYCPPHQTNPPDDRFIVLLDREEALYDEILTTPEKRTLQIQFAKNAAKIEVIATCLI